ncbi:MAG: transposase, partial [bacterium]
STIIGSFKSKSSIEYLKYIKQNNLNISRQIWQRSFYDHVIRNERSLNAIREYISLNPENWEQDIDNLINL